VILTINTHAALDRVIFIERFKAGTVMRASHSLDCVGGKGLDAAVVLSALGAPHLALSFIAGKTGELLVQALEQYGVHHELLWVSGDTRTAHVLVESAHHRHSHVMTPGYRVSETDCAEFLQRVTAYAPQAEWLILGGSLPPGAPVDFYAQVIQAGVTGGARTLIDCPGEPLVQALAERPDIVKMNREEFRQTFGIDCPELAGLAVPARALAQNYAFGKGPTHGGETIANLVITAGAEGILAVTAQGTYLANGPRLEAVNAAGAGDAVSAGLAYRLSLGDAWEEALRWAIAASAAVVLTEGTAECYLEDIQRLYPSAMVERLD
jgi:1-phosphofructokinase family hexose kinase